MPLRHPTLDLLARLTKSVYNPEDCAVREPDHHARLARMSDDALYPPLYLEGIAHFNECDFYESHEIWETLWVDYQGPSRKFYQGLIQAAVGLHHFGNGNIRGARKLYYSTRDYLEPYRPTHMGVDLDKFLQEFEHCFAAVTASSEDFPRIDIEPDLIPEIHLNPPATS